MRDYDPWLSQWLSPDPLYLSEPERGVGSLTHLNLYSYAGNNPISFVDRDGLQARETDLHREIATGAKEGAIAWGQGMALEMARPAFFLYFGAYDLYNLYRAYQSERNTLSAVLAVVNSFNPIAQLGELGFQVYDAFAWGGAREQSKYITLGTITLATALATKKAVGMGAEGRLPMVGRAEGLSVPRPLPGESLLNYGTRVYQEFPRIISETYPQAQGKYNIAPG